MPMISLSKVEQTAVSIAIEAMEACQLVFLPIAGSEETQNPAGSQYKKQYNNNPPHNSNNPVTGNRKEATDLFLQEKITLVLEPPIDSLVVYPKEMTQHEKPLYYRHWFLPADVKQVMHYEQKKYAIALKVLWAV